MKGPDRYVRISELAKLSGVPIKEIRQYIQKGILPRPIKINKTAAVYTTQHLNRLGLIRKLKKESKLSVPVIKDILKSVAEIEGRGTPLPDSENPSVVRDQLIRSSITVFQKKGYEGTTITDIVKAANIARRTFYKYFRGKEELFIECLRETLLVWATRIPDDGRLLSASAYRTWLKKAFAVGYLAFQPWVSMLNLLRAAAVKDPKTFAEQLQKSLEMRVRPVTEDIEEGIKRGVFREVNAQLLGTIFAGIYEYVCYFLSRGEFTQEAGDICDQTLDILFNGILAKTDKHAPSQPVQA